MKVGILMGYARAEMETTCVYDHVSKEWTVYTCVPNHLTKLSKIKEPYWTETEPDIHGNPRVIAGKWRLNRSQVRFAKMIERAIDEEENENEEPLQERDRT